MYKIGIDFGGTKVEGILIKDDILNPIFRKRILTKQELGYQAIINRIAGLIKELRQHIQNKDKFVIGMGMPGFVYSETKEVCSANIQCLNGKNFQKDLEQAVGFPIAMNNDANCFALSEACFGSAQDVDLVLGIILGTGMGGGLIYKKKIISGVQGYAGEIGHLSFDCQSTTCFCGNNGCNELYISGKSIQKRFQIKYKKEFSVSEIYQKYLDQDKNSVKFMNQILDNFGKIMANLIYMIAPEKIVIGGGVSKLPLLYKEGVVKVKQQLELNPQSPKLPPIVCNKLGDSSGVFGALSLV